VQSLPAIAIAEHTEVLHLVETNRLYVQGIGWVDAHLLASALVSRSLLFTSDHKLHQIADSLGAAYRSGL
jgi:hypothetical protein